MSLRYCLGNLPGLMNPGFRSLFRPVLTEFLGSPLVLRTVATQTIPSSRRGPRRPNRHRYYKETKISLDNNFCLNKQEK